MGRRTLHTGRPQIDNSPPGGWTHYGAEQHVEEMKKDRYESNKKVEGKFRIILTKPSGSKVIYGENWTYADAVREVEKEKIKEIRLGPHAGVYSIEKI